MLDCSLYIVFFFKQKTAYEMRISDWSSDVCSSDLLKARPPKHKSNSACCLPQSACSSPNLRSARHFPEPDRRLGTMRASDEQAAAGWWRPASGSLRSASDDLVR